MRASAPLQAVEPVHTKDLAHGAGIDACSPGLFLGFREGLLEGVRPALDSARERPACWELGVVDHLIVEIGRPPTAR